MEAVFFLIPLAAILTGLAVAAFVWAVNSGQFDDLDRAASQILFEDEPQDDPPSHQAAASSGEPHAHQTTRAPSPAEARERD